MKFSVEHDGKIYTLKLDSTHFVFKVTYMAVMMGVMSCDWSLFIFTST